jgi:hypothetical protein
MALKKKTIITVGLVFLFLFWVKYYITQACAIANLILAGIQYRYVNPDFKDFAWKHTSALEIASVVYCLFIGALGLCAFLAHKNSVLTAVISIIK